MKEPQVRVGILSQPQIEFILPTPYLMWGNYCNGVVTVHKMVCGKQTATYKDGQVSWNGQAYDELLFVPQDVANDAFELPDVTIGIHFHWERKESQRFRGALKLIPEAGKLTGINIVPVEAYLASVISSEMSATASLELLKAHAVISRSWLLANLSDAPDSLRMLQSFTPLPAAAKPGEETLRWYERDAHTRFDVCADDHCQRYQGITRATTERVREAVDATRGEVLMYGGSICDARFSKCCGGMLEEFRYCWKDVRYPYLTRLRDCKETAITATHTEEASSPQAACPDLTQEAAADRWIRTAPEAFCNTTDKQILAQVLNHYDQETTDFYRWHVAYTQEELAAIIRERSGIDYGQIIDLVPVARGTSGRIWRLKIVGTLHTAIIGKELEIRRTLSRSHLYSSAFVVDKEGTTAEGVPERFLLTGAGWGHGVGLCQIGAAVMGEQGYKYDAILRHYYTNVQIERIYDNE